VISVLSDENVHVDILTGLRQKGIHLVTATEVGLSGRRDEAILEYAEKHELLLLTGDKDFGGLIEFGRLWGRGKVLLLRYHILNLQRIINDIVQVLQTERETLETVRPVVIVLSESGYRIRRPAQ
jgi:predicted nuclease of predicted toxin-antitoxin system